MVGGDWVAVGYLVAAWYWAATLAGMRPRSLTGMPLAFALPGYRRCAHGLLRCALAGGAVVVRPCGHAR